MSLSAFGQISIDKFSLPTQGETLKTWVSATANVDLGTTDGPQVWDFTSLSKDVPNDVTLLSPSEGSVVVADATMLIKQGDLVERYLKTEEIGILEIHLKTLDPIFETFEISNSYALPPLYRKTTLIYGQQYSNDSKYQAPIAWDDLPDTITGSVGLSFDSIRVNTNFNRTDKIDAYGTVKLPDGEWEALRESTTLIRTVSIDVFFLGTWIEAPIEIIETALGGFADVIAPDTTYSTNFYTDKAIEVLAAFTLNDDGEPVGATFKAGGEITDIDLYTSKKADVSTYPNPSFGTVNFTFENCAIGDYTIQIYNVLGKKILSKNISVDSTKTSRLDLTMLKKGTYLYSVYDSSGSKITTKRIVILNP